MSYSFREILTLANDVFSKKSPLNTLHQELADHFYPERADFTRPRFVSDEFADHLMSGYPAMVRRDLGNSIGGMLRPRQKQWFEMVANRWEANKDHEAKMWLEEMTRRQRWNMYQKQANLARATKEGDHDFATFGNNALTVEMNKAHTGLIYRAWHLRDVAWLENTEQQIDRIFRRWKPTIKDLKDCFGEKKLAMSVRNAGNNSQLSTVNCYHMIVPSEMYEDGVTFVGTPYERIMDKRNPARPKYVSIYADVDNEHLIEAVPSRTKRYVISRWQTVAGSQYAHSPASIIALPDARLVQAITLVLLEAGERYVLPPMLATEEVIRSDLALYPGGVTWVDPAYDERLGQALRPVTTDKHGMPIGVELSEMTKEQIAHAFYLNKLTLPDISHEMTAFETGKRVEEYIRNALPLFEPMEMDYNGSLCEETSEVLFWNGAFGAPDEIPQALQGAEIEFKFSSPLHEQEGREHANKYLEASQILGSTLEVDPTIIYNVDIHKAFRGALEGIKVPSVWMRSEDEAKARVAEFKKLEAAKAMMQGADEATRIAKQGAEAEKIMGGNQ